MAFALVVLSPIGIYTYSTVRTQIALAEAESAASRDLPRWRLMELEEDRPQIPDAENSALLIIDVAGKMSRYPISGTPEYDKIFPNWQRNVALNPQQVAFLRNELAKMPASVEAARKLKDMPRGRTAIKFGVDFIATQNPNFSNAPYIADLLVHDAYLRAHDGEADRALESCVGVLNSGAVFDGEPMLMSHLCRITMQNKSVNALERVLAHGEPSEACLRELQSNLEKCARESSWLPAVRGERAGWHYLFENVQNGKLPSNYLRELAYMKWFSGRQDSFLEDTWTKYGPSLTHCYPEFLQRMNRTVEAAKLPFHERQAKLVALDDEVGSSDNILIRKFAPAFTKVSLHDAHGQALLRAAAVAVACERYRQRKNDWPESLDEVVRAKLLEATPRDPFDNLPLRFRRTGDGIVIYSVGADLTDDGGKLRNAPPIEATGADDGFRLWNVKQRPRGSESR